MTLCRFLPVSVTRRDGGRKGGREGTWEGQRYEGWRDTGMIL